MSSIGKRCVSLGEPAVTAFGLKQHWGAHTRGAHTRLGADTSAHTSAHKFGRMEHFKCVCTDKKHCRKIFKLGGTNK